MGKTSAKSGVDVDHPVEFLFVTCHDDEHVGILLSHLGQQALNHTVAEVGALGVINKEGVCLIDEEHLAFCFFEQLLHFCLRLAKISAHHLAAVGHNHVAVAQQTHRVENLADMFGHSGLSRSGIAEKQHVVGFAAVAGKTMHLSKLVEADICENLVNLVFQLTKANHATKG